MNTFASGSPSVVVCADGPLLLRGDVPVLDAGRGPVPRNRRTVALCRCGISAIAPWCDGSHRLQPGGVPEVAAAPVTAASPDPAPASAPTLPTPRGPVSAAVVAALRGRTPTGPVPATVQDALDRLARPQDVLDDDDLQVALFALQEQHYRGYAGVDPDLEWDGALIAARRRIERAVEAVLRALTADEVEAVLAELADAHADADAGGIDPEQVAAALFRVAARDRGPAMAAHLDKHATIEQFREFLTHRSIYQLKEADPHSFAIPRLPGRAKAALVEIQADEYGGGDPDRMHSTMFATTMRAAGLCDDYGHYVDHVPAATLANVTALSAFGLNRSLRGAAAGHLTAFEMTSSLPNRRYGRAARRLGLPEEAALYFDEHVEADAVHEQIAGRDLAGGLAAAEPGLLRDIVFGAVACLELDARWATAVMAAWEQDRSSLRAGMLTPA
jgi:CDGSH-type Zn-finger protein